MKVNQILQSKGGGAVETVKPGSGVADAAKMLSSRKIGALIVSPDGETAQGILSERDIVRELGRRGPSCLDDRVEDLMTSDIVGCAPSDDAESVLRKMTEGRFRHIPVMEGDRMVGLISIGDVVKARLAELKLERDALEGMVRGH